MSENRPTPDKAATEGAAPGRKLIAVLFGLTAVVTLMLCAFALPSIHSGPAEVPVGVTGSQDAADQLSQRLDSGTWDVTVYHDTESLTSAIEDRDVIGGIAVSSGKIDMYTAAAGAPSATSALTTLGSTLAGQQQAEIRTHELAPFTADDPRGAGFGAAGLPLVFGGMIPAVVLTRLFPGHRGLRMRLAGSVLFSLLAGAAVTALLQFGTGTLAGNYWLTSLGLSLGMAALSMTFIGLEALVGFAGLGAGAAVMMLLGNPLSALGSGPYWLPSGWALVGQILPPGAAGSLLRANSYFDGTGALVPALTLAAWVALGLVLMLLADRRGRRTGTPVEQSQTQPTPATA